MWWFSWSDQFDENLINNQDPHREIENNETPVEGAKYANESDSVEGDTIKLLHFPISCQRY